MLVMEWLIDGVVDRMRCCQKQEACVVDDR